MGEAPEVLDELVVGDVDLRGEGERERGLPSPAAVRAETFCADMARLTCSAEPEPVADGAAARVPALDLSTRSFEGAIGAVDGDGPAEFDESTCS